MGSAVPRALVLADSDSRWKWAALVARQLAPRHALDARFLHTSTTPTERQISEVGVVPDTSRVVTYAELLDDPAVAEADVVILGTIGGTVLALVHSLGMAWDGASRRPVVVSGYVGVVYENMVDGLLLRVGSDIVLANSPYDARRFREVYRGVGADPYSVVEAGLPFLGGERHDPSAAGRDRPFTVCFAVQPTVPAGRSARLGLLDKLQRHARRHPDREVLVKLRAREGETATRLERHPYQVLFDELPDPPPNLKAVHGDMGEVLDRTDLLVTISSTAAMEAIHRGIPTAILTDYGVREAHGNHFFVASGALASFAQLDEGLIPRADHGWAAEHGIGRRDPFAAAKARFDQLRDRVTPLPRMRPYYTPQNASDYLEALLARHGLGLSGRPLPAGSPANPTAVRKLIQRGAGGLYRVGRKRVAPVIRRLAQG